MRQCGIGLVVLPHGKPNYGDSRGRILKKETTRVDEREFVSKARDRIKGHEKKASNQTVYSAREYSLRRMDPLNGFHSRLQHGSL